MNIVIADQSARIRGQLKRFLEELPGIMVVGEASNLEDAMTVTQDLIPDLVVLNFPFPDRGGLSMIQEIKRMPVAPIIIVLSNDSEPEYRSACVDAGADYFFDKSLEFEKVQETVKMLKQHGNPPTSES